VSPPWLVSHNITIASRLLIK
ncbi:hypothetical protein Gotri_022349, partial [Gossypium trilobum]|nr:hypothetical protein [Gossypium trilobum]